MLPTLFIINVFITLFSYHVEPSDETIEISSSMKLPFEHAYPKHLRAKKVEESIVIDGRLDEKSWSEVTWTGDFVDIIKHENKKDNEVPNNFQSEVAVAWNDTYLFIGARMKEPFVYGTILGHNGKTPPYHDNDFEVFIDVSGTNYYYKEFEMNSLCATYDVNWGVPNGAGLKCDDTKDHNVEYLPVCVNTSFPGYNGDWTMKSTRDMTNCGMQTATQTDNFGRYMPGNEWTLEIAFPIQRSEFHGGLLDTSGDNKVYDKYHPKYKTERPVPLYWWIDFARAQHPRHFTSDNNDMYCPLDCSKNLTTYKASKSNPDCSKNLTTYKASKSNPDCSKNLTTYKASKSNPDAKQCEYLQKQFPTLLGSDPTYGCYFEWVLQDLGQRDAYMHRPLEWAILEFTDSKENCRNIEFIGRHALKLIYYAQKKHKQIDGTYVDEIHPLTQKKYCTYTQDCKDLESIEARRDIFVKVQISVIENISVLNATCTTRPCFTATLYIVIFIERLELSVNYVATINENMHVEIKHNTKSVMKICL